MTNTVGYKRVQARCVCFKMGMSFPTDILHLETAKAYKANKHAWTPNTVYCPENEK